MTVIETISVYHEPSSSESEGGGEAVEATLRVLAALRDGPSDAIAPSPSQSQYSQPQASAKETSSCKSFRGEHGDASDESQSKPAASVSSSSTKPMGHMSGYPYGVAPLQPSSRMPNHQEAPLKVKRRGVSRIASIQNAKKSGGLFSCCMRGADQQVVVQQTQSRASTAEPSDREIHQKNEQPIVATNQTKQKNEVKKEAETEKVDKLTPYERAMIERLRELLSMDGTSVPTLPTQIQLQGKLSPISLDITDSVIANTFSIDTKDLQQYPAQTDEVEENRSRQQESSTHSKESTSHSQRYEPTGGSDPSIPMSRVASATLSSAENATLSSSASIKKQGSGRELSDESSAYNRNVIVRTGSSSSRQSGTPEDVANANLKKSSSSRSKRSVASRCPSKATPVAALPQSASNQSRLPQSMSSKSKTSTKATAVTEVQKSMSHQSQTSYKTAPLQDVQQRMSRQLVSVTNVSSSEKHPPKPEKIISPTVDSSLLDIRKSSSVSSKSRRSVASQVYKSLSRSGSKNFSKRPNESDPSNQRHREYCRDQEPVKQTRSSLSNDSKTASLKYSSSNSTSASHHHNNIPEARQEGEIETRHNSRHETRDRLEPMILPPRPEITQRHKEPVETIISTARGRCGTEEQEAVECIYQLDTENAPPDIPLAYSAEALHRGDKNQLDTFTRATSAAPRFGRTQNLMYTEPKETNVLGEAFVENLSPSAENVLKVVPKDPKDVGDDISDLGMLSPKHADAAEKENVASGLTEPRKMDVFDMFTNGLFCFRHDTTTSV